MQVELYIQLFSNSLNTLENTIAAYPNEKLLWQKPEESMNSAGNLCLHLCGNLRHFIGHNLGKTAYVRQRETEFSTNKGSKAELIQAIKTTKMELTLALVELDKIALDAPYEAKFIEENKSNAYVLSMLYAHLSYHLGQISYLKKWHENKA